MLDQSKRQINGLIPIEQEKISDRVPVARVKLISGHEVVDARSPAPIQRDQRPGLAESIDM